MLIIDPKAAEDNATFYSLNLTQSGPKQLVTVSHSSEIVAPL